MRRSLNHRSLVLATIVHVSTSASLSPHAQRGHERQIRQPAARLTAASPSSPQQTKPLKTYGAKLLRTHLHRPDVSDCSVIRE
jgi:hypothetical protein